MNRLAIHNHPCFNVDVKGKCGRVHLPVAPDCNIKCNYCNRKYDCVNESRPGVTSSVLNPHQALLYLTEVLDKAPQITVAGIAGPGDAFARPVNTMKTIRLVRERFPDLLLCLATNGLNIGPYVAELAELNVSHVTITVNAVDPEIGARIYAWVRDGKVIYRGLKAAELLLARQLDAISTLKERGIIVKINTIVVPGINDHHAQDVAATVSRLGADIQNCMTMYPNKDTPFADIPEPGHEMMNKIRESAAAVIPQMRHCTRCRADAVGLLEQDRSVEFRGSLSACSRAVASGSEARPYVAVATMEGVLVNQHLGEAQRLQIWGESPNGYELIEERTTPEPGGGDARWQALAETLGDCRAVLVSGIGANPRKVLTENSILPIEMNGFIKMGLESLFTGRNMESLKARRLGCAKGGGCFGDAAGCG